MENSTNNSWATGTDGERAKAAAAFALDKHGVSLPDDDALRLANLMAEMQSLLSGDGSVEAVIEAEGINSSTAGVALGMQRSRIGTDIRGILAEWKEINRDPAIDRACNRLFSEQFGTELASEQSDQAIATLARVLWVNEGLGEDIGACLEEMIEQPGSHPSVWKMAQSIGERLKVD